MGGKVIEVKSAEEFQQLKSGKTSIVDFTATWCGPCQNIKPEFERLSNEYPTVQFLKVDVDELSDVAGDAGVRAMPTFMVYVNGEKVDELVGASKDKLNEIVKKYSK
ncbi:unnamed protein product [Brachionus calyciflorus]|uniref:Thioredoxin n=1 Tax=Brachionus calyciflorus TaxID=104777 RepID=A0A813T761_9BILA|nr:unnamed protein product [Brachionus calyciflorus]